MTDYRTWPEVAAEITRLREVRGLNVQDLASVSGIDTQTVAGIEAGDLAPTTSDLIALADAFGLMTDDLLLHADPIPPRFRADLAPERDQNEARRVAEVIIDQVLYFEAIRGEI